MTAAATTVPVAAARRKIVTRERILGVGYLILSAVTLIVFTGVDSGSKTVFGLNLGPNPFIRLPDLTVQSGLTAYLIAGGLAFLGGWQLFRGFGRRWSLALAIVAASFAFGFLTWAASGKSVSLVGVLQSTLQLSVPITFGALSGILCERAGVVNIAIEGMLLAGAFTGAVAASVAHNAWIGMIAAIVVGGLLAAMLAVLAIRYLVDQIIAGTIINIFALGLTSFLSGGVLQSHPDLNNPDRFKDIPIPVLSDIPIIGPVVFNNNIFVYLMFALIALIWWGLFYTRWGLRVRAVGEHPQAADTVGIDVIRTRYRNVILGGMVAGLGGAFFTLGSTGSFDQNMTAGRGFIGLAAMIFGAWNPIGAFGASLIFGFADSLQTRLSILSAPIPSEFLLMLPYIVTIIVVAGLVGKVRAPAADGKPYIKE